MKGDVELYLVAFVLLIIFVAILALGLFGNPTLQKKTTENVKELLYCKTDTDCLFNKQGKRCLLTYPGNYVPFCGCLTGADCNSGICSSGNKCLA